jgi:predicted Zn-dependent protease
MLELLATAIEAARAAGADDVEVSHGGRDLGMTRFAGSRLTQAGSVVESTTRVRVARGGRLGSATTSGLDREALAEAARRAAASAEHSPVSASFPGFARPDPTPPAGATGVAGGTRDFTPRARAEVLAGVFGRAARAAMTCAGVFTTSLRRRAVVTAGGVAVEHALTEATLSVIALDGRASGHAVWSGSDVARLDAARLAEVAVAGAARARDPVDFEPGPVDVVLSPAAVAEVCEWLSMGSFSARHVLDGLSLLGGRRGAALCDPRVSLVDDAGYPHPDAIAWPFDTEGTPRRRVPLIDAGRGGEPVSDRLTAARLGGTSTGHAAPFGLELGDEPVPANLVFHPGDATVEELVGRVERGLYVTRFHYVNGLLDTRRAVMTGMTRDGTFLIQDGKLGRAVGNLRFNDSILEALGRIDGIGRELEAVPTHWLMVGNYLCPALLVRGFKFTGRSKH